MLLRVVIITILIIFILASFSKRPETIAKGEGEQASLEEGVPSFNDLLKFKKRYKK
jgi:competence protein ComGC